MYPRDKDVHSSNGLFVFVHAHVEGLDVFGVVCDNRWALKNDLKKKNGGDVH